MNLLNNLIDDEKEKQFKLQISGIRIKQIRKVFGFGMQKISRFSIKEINGKKSVSSSSRYHLEKSRGPHTKIKKLFTGSKTFVVVLRAS